MQGLNEKQVILNRKKYGSNIITKQKSETFFELFLETLGDPIIKILLIVLAIKVLFLFRDFDWYETIGIVIAIFVASFISTISEYGSNKAFQRLQEESSKIKCRVLRNNKVEEINIDDVVNSDIILLSSGDRIPADGIIIRGNVTVDESSMNGETKEQLKRVEEMLYRNTIIYEGNCYMKVTSVGDNTYYGKLAQELQEKSTPSPLKIRLINLAKIISRIGYISAILVSISFLFSKIVISNNFNLILIKETITNFPLLFGYILNALTLSVTIIVVAVPEGLPMMITLVLSSNMKRMLKNNVLVRKLVGIETAGNINILFTDKTGTLTKGKLEVVSFMTGNLEEYNSIKEIEQYPKYLELLKNNLIYNNTSFYDEISNKIIGGNTTDRALLEFVKENKSSQVKIINNIPFNSDKKYSLTIIDKNKKIKLIKGAPELILKNTNYYLNKESNRIFLKNKEMIQSKIDAMTKKGIRVLALSYSDSNIENNLDSTLLSIIFIRDDIRLESKNAISLVDNANIQTVMLTGDNKDTAISIAKEVGLLKNKNDIILTGSELNSMSDNRLKEIIPNLKIVARALPQDKSKLINICKELNLVVGMTGDGVNDAPALKKADVGFAMGSGTEISKEASDIVILDDNFNSIATSILYGRTIFKSIRKFIIFQLTVNLCAVSVSIIGPFIGIPYPVTVIQMLWINMVMDTLAGLAFSYEPALLEYMNEQPKKKNEHIINKYMLNEILVTGTYSAALCIFFLKSPYINSLYRYSLDNKYLMTAFFGLFIFIGINNCFNARSNRLNIFSNLLKNKAFIFVISFIVIIQIILIYYGGTLFRTSGLTIREFIIMFILSLTVIPFDFLRKTYLKRHNKCLQI